MDKFFEAIQEGTQHVTEQHTGRERSVFENVVRGVANHHPIGVACNIHLDVTEGMAQCKKNEMNNDIKKFCSANKGTSQRHGELFSMANDPFYDTDPNSMHCLMMKERQKCKK